MSCNFSVASEITSEMRSRLAMSFAHKSLWLQNIPSMWPLRWEIADDLRLQVLVCVGSSYRLELTWVLDDDSTVDVIWTQTSSPLESTIQGFNAISADAINAHEYSSGATCAKFDGLGKSPETACVLDGNGNGDCFFNCAGTVLQWNGEDFIPGPMERKAKSVVLYLLKLPQANYHYQLLARQVPGDSAGECYMNAFAKRSWKQNSHDPDASCYMNLDPLMESGA